MKKILLTLLLGIFFQGMVYAGVITKNVPVAVMDFGYRPGATETSINIDHAGQIAADYVIDRLVEGEYFKVMDKDTTLELLREKKLKTSGLIDPTCAKQIGELLKVEYLIYGYVCGMSVSDVSGGMVLLSNGLKVDVCTVKAHIIGRMIDVKTGMIVKCMKGDGVSRSSHTEIGVAPHVISLGVEKTYSEYGNGMGNDANAIKGGTIVVTQESVHNALQKAADNMVLDLLLSVENSGKVKNKK